MHLLLKGHLRLGCNALKQPTKSNLLKHLKRCHATAVVKAEIEPFSTYPDRISHHLKLHLFPKMMGKVMGSPVHYLKLLGREDWKMPRLAWNSSDECRLW